MLVLEVRGQLSGERGVASVEYVAVAVPERESFLETSVREM